MKSLSPCSLRWFLFIKFVHFPTIALARYWQKEEEKNSSDFEERLSSLIWIYFNKLSVFDWLCQGLLYKQWCDWLITWISHSLPKFVKTTRNEVGKALFTYYVSQKLGGPDRPSPPCQLKIRNWLTPCPPCQKNIRNWLTPPSPLVRNHILLHSN